MQNISRRAALLKHSPDDADASLFSNYSILLHTVVLTVAVLAIAVSIPAVLESVRAALASLVRQSVNRR